MFKRKLSESADDNAEATKQAKSTQHINVSKDKTLKYDFMISLQNIVTAKVIGDFWMDQKTQIEIVKLFRNLIGPEHPEFAERWWQIERNIVTRISKLLLPVTVIEKLKNIVPVIGNSLLNWIRYHDEYVLESAEVLPYSAVDFIGHVMWTARGKIDYAATAKNILVYNADMLSNDSKYKIACTYCFLEEIGSLYAIVKGKYYLDSIDIEIHPMVHFWTAHIKRNGISNLNYSLCKNPSNDISIYEHLMWLLMDNNGSVKRTFNEIPIMYVWKKLSREEKAKCISPLIEQISNEDYVYSILSSIDYELQRAVFMDCSNTILTGILHDWLWEDYFLPTALQILDTMNPLSYLDILEEVNKAKNKNSKQENTYLYRKFKSIFKQLWEKCPIHFKHFFYNHKCGFLIMRLLRISIIRERDIDLLELILNDFTVQEKKELIFEYNGINYCYCLIRNARWYLLDLLIKHTLFYEDDVNHLKEILLCERKSLALHFLDHRDLNEMENFLIWSYKSEEERDEFRRSLAYSNIYPATLRSVIYSNKIDFRELENHFKWCAKNNPELIAEFKAGILKCPNGKALINELMKLYKYELIDKVLSWCLSENQKEIARYKSNMHKDERYIETIRSLTSNLIAEDGSFKLLDEFINWNFTNEKEIEEFKTWMLYPLKIGEEVLCSPCRDLLGEYNFELADKFTKWCVISSKAISTFKNEYMLSNDMFYILCKLSANTHDLKLLINWFGPSEETLAEFKTIFLEDDCPCNICKILHDFFEKLWNF